MGDFSYQRDLAEPAADWICSRDAAFTDAPHPSRSGGHSAADGEGSLWLAFSRAAQRHSSATALVCHDGLMSYGQLRDSAQAFAAGLIESCGLQAGERVAVVAGNRLEWLALSLAIQAAGAVEVPCRPSMPADELLPLLRDLAIAVAVVELPELAQLLQLRGHELPVLRRLVLLEPDPKRPVGVPLENLGRTGAEALFRDASLLQRRQWRIGLDSTAAIIQTSGTTGEPKAVLLSQQNLLHAQFHLPRHLGLVAGERILVSLPLWHLYGRLIAYVGLASGATLHLGDLAQVEADLEQICPDCCPAFPPVWEKLHHRCIQALRAHRLGAVLLAALGLRRRYVELRLIAPRDPRGAAGRRFARSLAIFALWLPQLLCGLLLRLATVRQLSFMPRLGIVGDAPLAPGVDADLHALGIEVLQGYGSTEQLVSCMRRPGDNRPGNIGSPLPQVELLIVDEGLRPLPAGSIGQIAVSGPNVCAGYVDGEVANARAFVPIEGRRWHLTGDLGWCDGQSRFHFVGRLAHVLHTAAGEAVYPEPIENLLRDSAVIERAMVYARGGGGLGVLVIPNMKAVPADKRGRVFLLGHEINRLLQSSALPRTQRPDHFAIAVQPLAIGRELTPTLKLRRCAIRIPGEEFPL